MPMENMLSRIATAPTVAARREIAGAIAAALDHPQADRVMAVAEILAEMVSLNDEWPDRALIVIVDAGGLSPEDADVFAHALYAAGLVQVRPTVFTVAAHSARLDVPVSMDILAVDILGQADEGDGEPPPGVA